MSFKPAIASMSLGRAWCHDIRPKFEAAAQAGLPGIEIFFEDLIYLAQSYVGGLTPSNQILAAQEIKHLADSLSLEIIACGPFSNCEGLLSSDARREKLDELHLWFEICHILGTDIIQIPCTFMTEGVTGDVDIVARDLREIADLGAEQNPPFRFAFENLCFGTFFDTWSKAWKLIQAVDRPNFGFCLDTFNIAGREYADPASPDGKVENADQNFRASLKNMVQEIDVRKVFYVQVVDAERLDRVLDEKHPFYVKDQKSRMSWSRNARLFICEEDKTGYLPVMDVMRAICDEKNGLGYKGWVSMELFNRSLCAKDSSVPTEHAQRAMKSWRTLGKRMSWGRDSTTLQKSSPSRAASFQDVEEAEFSARL